MEMAKSATTKMVDVLTRFISFMVNAIIDGFLIIPALSLRFASTRKLPDITRHAAFRFVEQALKNEASFFSQLERCGVLGKDSEDNLASFCCRTQILIHEFYGL